ncbi:MAG: hypothetical protein DIZ77_18850 [endosymbiont of Seepiophila jonesi]|uniref:T6SS Phospholipase effector Tle1-like catalytic domain-containing protein n=1 Tax=endosymbiont of Lamellibrachia luymesi TaxID=2200907 RepID=A0A370DXE5_9GAMM|nr:MAG: hypothetical protein DIZ77_18850 [endosymbiont of Seepiophila jonesi]RDH90091.1 MAG: hypothetical protein DIZ79_10175 [endosymbiont of Lamellibrachia luymesi]
MESPSAPRVRRTIPVHAGAYRQGNFTKVGKMDSKNKKIILFSDGTGNSAASRNRTNVRRLYDTLDLQKNDQVAFYDDGVGSQEFLLFKILGGAFGYGLKRNVRELYKTLCRSYNEGDKIYLFGFSRGAFTTRVLAGMIAYCGLKTDTTDETELDRIAQQNYSAFRSQFHQTLLSRLYRKILRLGKKNISNEQPRIQFIGVWDTVDAYGLSIDELSVLWDKYIFPIRFPDRCLSKKVIRACHAVSVDDERLTFHPLLWNETKENAPSRIDQVWFSGVHADVGGGYPMDNLSLVPLDWMISKVESFDDPADNLQFIQAKRKEISQHADWHGVQHDSRAGAGAYYRYKPRHIDHLCNDQENGVEIKRPKIHRSVLERIRRDVVPYVPTGLPANYEVVSTRSQAPEYEKPQEALARAEAMNPALDVIFWRRWLYGLLLVTTALFLGSRFYLDWTPDGSCVSSACAIDPILVFAKDALPDSLGGWFDAWRQNPIWLWSVLAAFALFTWLKAIAWHSTQAHAGAAWAVLKGKAKVVKSTVGSAAQEKRHSRVRKFRKKAHSTVRNRSKSVLAHLALLVILYLILAVFSHSILHVRASFGGLCDQSEATNNLEESNSVTLYISNPCSATSIALKAGQNYRFEAISEGLLDRDIPSGPEGTSPAKLIPLTWSTILVQSS